MSQPLQMTLIIALFAVFLSAVTVLFRLMGRHIGKSPFEQDVVVACTEHDFDRVLELAKQHPLEFQKSPALRYSLALCEAFLGHRELAISRLAKLWQDEPDFTDAALTMSVLQLEEDRPHTALDICEQVVAMLPKDPTPRLALSWCLRECGRLEEADTAVQSVLAEDADCGEAYAFLSAINFDRGHHDTAKALLTQAEQHAPGTTVFQFIRAQQTVSTGTPKQAAIEVQKAIHASDANPFAVLQKRVQRLASQVGLDTAEDQ